MLSNNLTIEDVKTTIRNIPDFPKKGIQFKDITTMLKSPKEFSFLVNSLYDRYKDLGVTKVVGVESRGFILGGALAYKLGAGFVPIRKKGKLPASTYQESYALEYGTDTLEVHQDALSSDDIVLIHDDLLATGGTMDASIRLAKRCGVSKIYVSFICELDFLHGREKIACNCEVVSLINF